MKRFFVASVFALVGCSTTASENIRTSGIVPSIYVQADGDNSATVYVDLRLEDSLTFLELTGEDDLYAEAFHGLDGTSINRKQLTKGTWFGATYYGATFTDLDVGLEDTEYVISFDRTVDDSAPDSSVFLPASVRPMTVDNPAGNIDRDGVTAISISWANPNQGYSMSWALDGATSFDNCVRYASGVVPGENGAYAIPGSQHQSAAGYENDDCQVAVDVIREKPGAVDSHFAPGGKIGGQQYGFDTFNSLGTGI